MDNYKDGYYLAKFNKTGEIMPVKVILGKFWIFGYSSHLKSTAFSEIKPIKMPEKPIEQGFYKAIVIDFQGNKKFEVIELDGNTWYKVGSVISIDKNRIVSLGNKIKPLEIPK